jgi:hypothetical protein
MVLEKIKTKGFVRRNTHCYLWCSECCNVLINAHIELLVLIHTNQTFAESLEPMPLMWWSYAELESLSIVACCLDVSTGCLMHLQEICITEPIWNKLLCSIYWQLCMFAVTVYLISWVLLYIRAWHVL